MTVAIGLYKSAPKFLDGLAPKKPTTESSSSRDGAGGAGYYNVKMSIPDAVVIVSVRDSPLPEYNKPIGSSVLVSKVVAGKKRLMLLTARHVATAVVNLHGMVTLGLRAKGNTVKNVTVKKALWLADTESHISSESARAECPRKQIRWGCPARQSHQAAGRSRHPLFQGYERWCFLHRRRLLAHRFAGGLLGFIFRNRLIRFHSHLPTGYRENQITRSRMANALSQIQSLPF